MHLVVDPDRPGPRDLRRGDRPGTPSARPRSSAPAPSSPTQTAAGMPTCGPCSGPVLGPFDRRSEALAAEVAWLEQHWLLPGLIALAGSTVSPFHHRHEPARRPPRPAGRRARAGRGAPSAPRRLDHDPGPARPLRRRPHRRVAPHRPSSRIPARAALASWSPRTSAWSSTARSAAGRARTPAGRATARRPWPSA